MRSAGPKQLTLKPQDLVVVLKIALLRESEPTFARLATELSMSVSEAHAAVQRALACHLLLPSYARFAVDRSSLHEFLLHGVRYAFPLIAGSIARGIPTGVSAAPMKEHFAHGDSLPLVWADPLGELRGIAVAPLYPRATEACKADPKLHSALALLDALRGGAAREREMAERLLMDLLL